MSPPLWTHFPPIFFFFFFKSENFPKVDQLCDKNVCGKDFYGKDTSNENTEPNIKDADS